MTAVRVAWFVTLALAACGDDGAPIQPPDGSGPIEPVYWTPTPGEAADWDVQLVAPRDVSATRQMYLLDLWDVATATTINYADGTPTSVSVPAGPLAGKVAELHATGAKVVCQVGAGAIKLTDPDAARFPGFAANPPDDPTAPAAGSVVGWSVIGDPNTRYLDIRSAGRALWASSLQKRIELAKALACDAVDVAWVDRNLGDDGFLVTGDDLGNTMTAAYSDVEGRIHDLEISAGWHATTFAGQALADGFVDGYDFAIIERCAEFDQCDLGRPFVLANKAVFAIDFNTDGTTDRDGDTLPDGIDFTLACAKTLPADWVHKDADAAFRSSSSYRMAKSQCP